MRVVLIVGVGALGSHVVQFLRNVDASLRVVDFDRVEQKNVTSQFHSKPSVGKSKVQGLQQTMQFLFATKIEAIPHRLVDHNVGEMTSKADLMIDALDNAEGRAVMQRSSRTLGIPCLHGALAADGAFGRVVWDEDFVIDAETQAGAATCEGGEFLPFIAMTAAYMAQAAQEFLKTGKKLGYQIHAGGAVRI